VEWGVKDYPLKILLAQSAKIFKTIFAKILAKIAKYGGK
jgi:hypothetical protein